jgi:serine/threonine-protein kinase
LSAIPLRRIEGKYEILGKLREGGMGAIYKVRHRLLDEVRVIKLMRPQFLEDEELKARFLREARLAIKLRHTNIAQLYDFTIDEEDGTALIVMEFIDGKTLEDLLTGGPPPLGLTLEIAQQSLRALGYLHGKGLIHRDISPDNLMITRDAEGQLLVKLIDLGIAKILGGGEGLTQTGTFLGKVRYASPEQFSADGTAGVDVRGDLYSFGIVLYELLTGRYPIPGKDPSSLIAGHLFRPPLDFAESDPDGRLSPGLRAAVLRALAKSAGERFATAQDFSRALAAFRVPGDISELDLHRALHRFAPEAAIPAPPGSTQGRLDEQFGLEVTPRPATAVTPPAAAEPTPVGLALPDLQAEAAAAERREEERQREIAAVVATIEEDLTGGDFAAAETRLQEAEAAYGAQEAFAALHRRLAELRLQKQKEEEDRRQAAEIAALVAGAQQLAEANDFKSALRDLRKAAKLAPGDDSLRAQIAATEERSRRHSEEKKRAARIDKAAVAVTAALDAGELDRAHELLDKAAAKDPEAESFTSLRARLAELRRAGELAAAVAAINEALDRNDLDEAGALLDRAVVHFGGEAALRAAWERLEAQRRAEHERRLKTVLTSARALQSRGELEAALGAARKAAEIEPENREARTLKIEIETALLGRELDLRVGALLHDSRRLEKAGDLAAAVKKLHEAADLDAAHAEIQTRLPVLETELRRRDEAQRRAGELAVTAAAVGSLLQRGELDEAERLLTRALSEDGTEEERAAVFQALRGSIEELRRRREEEARAAEPVPPPEPALQAPQPEISDGILEAAQAIAERLAGRDTDGALKELHDAEARFGANEAFTRLRKSLAAVVLDDTHTAAPTPPQPPADLPLRIEPPPSPPATAPEGAAEEGRFKKLFKKWTGQ